MPSARATALLSGLPLASGCSLLFDFTVEQCKYDADCNAADAGEAQLWCEQGLCVSRPDCQRNDDCQGEAPETAQICVASKCQSLRGRGCFTHFPNTPAIGDSAIVLGAFSPNRTTSKVVLPLLNYELAVSELNSTGGLNGRQVVLVVCDNGYGSSEDERTVKAGFDHLATELRVPAIVAGLNSAQAVRTVFLSQAQPTQVPFLLVPFASDEMVIENDQGLIWYLVNPTDNAPALVALAQRVEAGLARRGLAESARVALWRGAGQTASALWMSLEPALHSAYPALDAIDAGAKRALEELVAARPHIVLVIDGDNFVEQLGELEARWQESWPEQEPPVYLLAPQNAAGTSLTAFLQAEPAVDAARFVGIHPHRLGDPQVIERYAERFLDHFPAFVGVINGWNYYDAVYYLAYAAFAGRPRGTRALTNGDVQLGFERLSAGEDVEIGPQGIQQAVAALSTDRGTIQFEGTLGPAIFQRWSGTPIEAATAVFCMTRAGDEVAYRYDVLVYDADSRRLAPGADNEPCSDLLTESP